MPPDLARTMHASPPEPSAQDQVAPASASTVKPVPAPAAARTVWERIAGYRRLISLALALFVADQLSKAWIIDRFPFPTYPGSDSAWEVIPGLFYIVHVRNAGAAWSLFAGFSGVLALLAVATLAGIFHWRAALGLRHPATQISFGLLCGGITGNLLDRLLHHGYVVDFLDFHFGSYVYPTFNIADCGICLGVIAYLWQSLRTPPKPTSPEASG